MMGTEIVSFGFHTNLSYQRDQKESLYVSARPSTGAPSLRYRRLPTNKSIKMSTEPRAPSVNSELDNVEEEEEEGEEVYTMEDAYNEINSKPLGRFQICHMLAQVLMF
jgi:hypothetical protein